MEESAVSFLRKQQSRFVSAQAGIQKQGLLISGLPLSRAADTGFTPPGKSRIASFS